MSPPGGTPATPAPPALGVNQEVQHLSTRVLVREARKVVSDLDIHLGGSRLRSLVRRYVETGRPDIDFRTWFISYADPTGETAVRNVMRRAKVGEPGGR